jgi:hypothetical protein
VPVDLEPHPEPLTQEHAPSRIRQVGNDLVIDWIQIVFMSPEPAAPFYLSMYNEVSWSS